MIHFDANIPVMIAIYPLDFRAGLNKLSALAESLVEDGSEESGIFVFRNKRRTDIKIIFYNENGYFLGHKRLSKGKLSWWPRTEYERLNISSTELLKLLKGVDPRKSFHPDLHRLKTKDLICEREEDPQH
jgi:transposase